MQGNVISEARSRQKYCTDIVIRLKDEAETHIHICLGHWIIGKKITLEKNGKGKSRFPKRKYHMIIDNYYLLNLCCS